MGENIREEEKRKLKELGKSNIQYLQAINYISLDFTGSIRIELNLNGGIYCDMKIAPEARIK